VHACIGLGRPSLFQPSHAVDSQSFEVSPGVLRSRDDNGDERMIASTGDDLDDARKNNMSPTCSSPVDWKFCILTQLGLGF
jgi:hypothetical protein